MTYTVVGCSSCQALWLLDDAIDETVQCPTCGTRHDRTQLRTLAEAPDRDAAAQQRSALIAARRGHADADLDPYAVQAERADDPIVDDREYLDGLGLDAEVVAALTDSPEPAPDDTDVRTQTPGAGPDVTVSVAERPQLTGTEDGTTPGVSLLDPESQLPIAGHTYRNVSPRTSEWLGDVLADTIPQTARLVQDIAATHPKGPDPRDPTQSNYEVPRFIQTVLADEIAGLDSADASASVVEEARAYLDAIGRYALLWADDTYRAQRGFNGDQQFERIRATLETSGTSRGPFNAGVETLRHSLTALHAQRHEPAVLTFICDGEAWTAASAETIKRALTAFDVLGTGFDVRLWIAPGVRQRIRRLVASAQRGDMELPAWAQRFAFLTADGDRSRRLPETTTDTATTSAAWEFVEQHSTEQGLLTVLAQLPDGEARSVRALKHDATIDYADGSIDRYVAALEEAGLATVDRSHASNRVTLTARGQAAQQYLTPTGEVVPPAQSQLLGASYGHPSAEHKCSVIPQQTGGDHHPPAERWLADTGDPTEAGYVQFLGDRTGPREVEPPVLHRRILAAERVSGVNFADSDIIDWTDDDAAPTGDGRVTYVSVFNEQALCVTQWGGPAQTLARLCSGLLGNKMLSKGLSIDAVGRQFEQVHGGVEAFENDLEDVLTRAQQIGWLSEDELAHYDNWRDRIGDVRSTLLSKLSEFDDLDSGQRQALFSDLQGLLCSATHLYHAAGLDVTFNIRLPRTRELQHNADALEDFCAFMRYTVPKQAGYEDQNGFHSSHRMLVEDRPQKLRARAAYELGSDPTADLTASWIITGPDATSLQPDVEEAIAAESTRLREQVAEGVEDAACVEIPTVAANPHGHIRSLVRELADWKGFTAPNRQDLDRLTRCLEAALATADRGPDPCLVADVLLALEARDTPHDQLDTWAIQHALSTLPSTAIFPTLPPAARRMLAALFASDEPLTRQDLIEITSESSYDRHWKTLRAFFLVERTDEGFVAHLEPWWAPDTGASEPFHEPNPTVGQPPAAPRHVLLSVVWDSGHLDVDPERYYELGKQGTDWLWILAELGLARYQPILAAYCDCPAHVGQSYSDPSGVQIGPPSRGSDPSQATLSAAS